MDERTNALREHLSRVSVEPVKWKTGENITMGNAKVICDR